MSEEYPYQKQWEEYRRLRNRQYIVFAIGGVLINIVDWILNAVSKNNKIIGFILPIAIFIWFFGLIFSVVKFHRWKCPRCDERFFQISFWIRMPELLNNCKNCELPKYKGSTFYA